MIWVYPNPGAAPSQDSIPGECLHPKAAAVLQCPNENKSTEISLLVGNHDRLSFYDKVQMQWQLGP